MTRSASRPTMLFSLVAIGLSACSSPETSTLQTSQGTLAGQLSEAGIHDFRAIPYARPPVGEMRFRPPGPVPDWEGVREATAFSPMCMQSTDASGDLLDRVVDGHGLSAPKRALVKRVARSLDPGPVSEDCLYLNVRTPDPQASLPVMVWIHGGGHQFGSADFGIYQGDALPARGVVVVTPNYRLNAFGYLAHPALSEESETGTSGNYGLQDQIAALEWVRDHIAEFGGDPERVTIFGESAGASSIAAIMASPKARGLFHRAVMQSGESTRSLSDLADAEGVGEMIAREVGVRTADELRAAPAADILSALSRLEGEKLDSSARLRPIADGVLLPTPEAIAFRDGAIAVVPTLAGYNADEAGIFYTGPEDAALSADLSGATPEARLAALTKGYGEAAEDIARVYGLDGTRNVDDAARDLMGDEYFGISTRFVLEGSERAGAPVWAYAFTRVPPSERQTIGAFHSAEIPFLFGTQEGALGVSDQDEALEDRMQAYWVNFAKTGDPNGEGLPQWPQYRGQNWMELTANTGRATAVVQDWRGDKLDALEAGLDEILRTQPDTRAEPERAESLD